MASVLLLRSQSHGSRALGSALSAISCHRHTLGHCRVNLLSTCSASSAESSSKIRLSKLLSHQRGNLGISRREAERLIRDGQVTVAGQIVTSPSTWVDPNSFKAIKVANRHLVVLVPFDSSSQDTTTTTTAATTTETTTSTRVWLAHKLRGELVSERDPHGRPCLLERLRRGGLGSSSKKKHRHRQHSHIKPVGRLDMPTEGLVVLTNSGTYARQLELPANAVHRVYRARVHGHVTPHKLKRMRRGMTVQNTTYRGMKVELEQQQQQRERGSLQHSSNTWMRITCTEGKNRQIRNVMNHLGLKVIRLIRVAYGDYQLHTIPPGMAIQVPVKPLEQQRRKGPLNHGRVDGKQSKQRFADTEHRAPPVEWIRHVSPTRQ